MKKIKKILLVLIRCTISFLSYINVDLYMWANYRYLKFIGIDIKKYPKYISNSVYFDGSEYSNIKIGSNVTISREVMFLTHDYSLTTAQAALGIIINRHEGEAYFSNGITIGDHCFIGARASLLPGTLIGDNVIIGSCAVVKGNIPSNSIVIGNPCSIVGKTSDWVKKKLEGSHYNVEL